MKKASIKSYTKSQLALRNGQDKEEIWCSYEGKIYDLSNSGMWRAGRHHEHWAGQDLTNELDDAPHDVSVFDRHQIVGVLTDFEG